VTEEQVQTIHAALDAMSDVTRQALELADDDDTAYAWMPSGITANAYRWLRDLLDERERLLKAVEAARAALSRIESSDQSWCYDAEYEAWLKEYKAALDIVG
jgi:hypothetical protein